MNQRIPNFDDFVNEAKSVPRENTERETVLDYIIKNKQVRLEKLKEIKAPEIIITGTENQIHLLKSGQSKIKGLDIYGSNIYKTLEWRKGNGGVDFIQFVMNDDSVINYFPNAKYGAFFAPNTKK
ncbi:MAG: hypothetical protein WC979_02585 [Candidatus Pacearchaeota archaeon]|nr:hypothetical protein [Clostridia bacterium]